MAAVVVSLVTLYDLLQVSGTESEHMGVQSQSSFHESGSSNHVLINEIASEMFPGASKSEHGLFPPVPVPVTIKYLVAVPQDSQ